MFCLHSVWQYRLLDVSTVSYWTQKLFSSEYESDFSDSRYQFTTKCILDLELKEHTAQFHEDKLILSPKIRIRLCKLQVIRWNQMMKIKILFRLEDFLCHIWNGWPLFKLMHWAFALCVLNIVIAVYLEHRTPGRIISMASFCRTGMAICSCTIVSLSSCGSFFFSLVLSVEWLSDVLVAIFTTSDKSINLTPDRAWRQHLKWTQESLNIGQPRTRTEMSVKLCSESIKWDSVFS